MNLYFAMAPTVSSKPSRHYLCNYLLTEHDIIQLCSSGGNGYLSGGGIFWILSDGSRMIFKYHLLLDSMRTLQFWNNKPAKRITMIQRRIMGMQNTRTKNWLVQSYLNEAYGDALLSQSICDVFEEKSKNFKGNIFSSVVKNSDSSSWCITEMFRYVLISMLHTLYLLNLMSNFWIVVFHQKSFCSPYLYWYRLWHSKTMPYGLLWKIFWGYKAVFYFR